MREYMKELVPLILENIKSDYFSDCEILNFIEGSANRRYSLIKRAIAKGEIVHIRRGLYCLAERYRKKPLNLFTVAQRIYGPSYISLESALNYHGWIPEAVHTVTSVTSRRSKMFDTPLGLFDYKKVICDPLFIGVESVANEGENFFMARPLKAVADYIYVYKKDWRGMKPLTDSLRIEEELLNSLTASEFEALSRSYQNRRVLQFLSGLRKELKL